MDEDTRPNIHLYFTASYEGVTEGRLTSQARFCFSYTRFLKILWRGGKKKGQENETVASLSYPNHP